MVRLKHTKRKRKKSNGDLRKNFGRGSGGNGRKQYGGRGAKQPGKPFLKKPRKNPRKSVRKSPFFDEDTNKEEQRILGRRP